MSAGLEAAGDLALAGAAAGALDGPSSPRPHDQTHCANCGAALAGDFCHACGQRAHLHRSVGDVVHEVLHGVTHFDGRFWTTLPMLLFRPGRLIRSYIEGHRARYIAPVPLFLMVVFLMFFVLSFVGFNDNLGPAEAGSAKSARIEMTRALADIDRDIAAARKAGDAAELKRLQGVRGVVSALDRQAADGKATASVGERVAEELAMASERGELTVVMGVPTLDAKAREALKNPKLVLYKLQTKAYKLSFLLVPLSLPWLWLVFFWRRGVGMYDHAVFALYSISFISLLFITGSLLLAANVTSQWVWVPLLLAPGAHMFASLRGAYALSGWEAGWRTLYLSVAAMMSLSFYLVILVILGILD